MRVIELVKKKVNKRPKAEVEDMIKKMRADYERPIKGRFEFCDAEGGFFSFTERMFPGDGIQTIELIHGEVCEIPAGLAKRLNNTVHKIKRYQNLEQPPRGAIKHPRTFETKSRVRFIPVDML